MPTAPPAPPVPPAPPAVPSRQELVAEAVGRLDTLGLRSQLVKLDGRTLSDLCLRLSDRRVTVADAHRWLNEELGGSADEEVVDDNAVYRFADSFRQVYGQVRAEHARRVARLTVSHATDGRIRDMTRVSQARLAELTAEKLVEADSFDDLGKAVQAAMFAVKFAQDAGRADEDLERKQRETAAKLEQLRHEREQDRRRLKERVKALRSRVEELSQTVQRGRTIDPSVFDALRAELAGLAEPRKEAA